MATTIISLTTAGDVVIGGNGVQGDVMLKRKDGQTSVSLRGDAPENILVRDRSGKPVLNFVGDAFDNKAAALWLGTHTADGGTKAALVVLRGRAGNDAIVFNGGEGENIFVRDAGNKPVFNFAGDAFDGKIAGLWIGAPRADDGGKKPGLIVVRDNEGRDSIVIDGAQGDIVFNNADCAEDFEVSDAAGVEPGVVMVIGDDGRLRPSDSRIRQEGRGRGRGCRGMPSGDRAGPPPLGPPEASDRAERSNVLPGGCQVCCGRRRRSVDDVADARTCDEGDGSSSGIWRRHWQGAASARQRQRFDSDSRLIAVNAVSGR